MNNLLELGGSVDLIATAICDFDTPTKHYNKGDIVLNFQNLHSQLITNSKVSQGRTDVLSIEHSILTLSSIQFPVVPLENQIYGLLGKEKQKELITKFQKIKALGTSIILNDYVKNVDSLRIPGIKNYQVIDNEQLKTTVINSDEFVVENNYIIQYDEEIEANPIFLDSQESSIPYLKLQLKVNGNADKENWSTYVLIEKASLRFNPSLIFTDKAVTYCSLIFNVIYDKLSPKPRILMW